MATKTKPDDVKNWIANQKKKWQFESKGNDIIVTLYGRDGEIYSYHTSIKSGPHIWTLMDEAGFTHEEKEQFRVEFLGKFGSNAGINF
jgi:hypothetical protein